MMAGRNKDFPYSPVMTLNLVVIRLMFDLIKQYQSFGLVRLPACEPQNLVGIAVSSDSDDTGTEVVASISNFYIY